MFGKMQDLNGLMEMLGKSGINIKSLIGLFSGKDSPEEKKKVIFPLLCKLEPGFTASIAHLEKVHGQKVFIVCDKKLRSGTEDKFITVVSICTKNENKSLNVLEQIHFPELGNHVIDILDQQKQTANKTENLPGSNHQANSQESSK